MDVFEALADPTRREIVALLAHGDRNAGDIAGRFPIAAPSVSRHLKVLRESGLVSVRADAQARIYRLEAGAMTEARQWMDVQLTSLHARFDRLADHLDKMRQKEGDDGRG
jgi:DNA-binding transcriptional ArsR family regulator